MRKFLPYVIAFVLVAGGIAAYFLTKKGTTFVTGSTRTSTTPTDTNGNYEIVDACTILTQADADALLGGSATKVDTSIGNTATNDINVSTCSYSVPTQLRSVTLLARSAKSAAGAAANRTQATSIKPEAAQDVSDFGESAYWDPTYGQLNVFKHSNWYILSSGGLKPSDKTLDGAKAMAARIISRL